MSVEDSMGQGSGGPTGSPMGDQHGGRRCPLRRWAMALAGALLAGLGPTAGALEVHVEAVLAPFNRPIEVHAWADFRMVGSDSEIHRLFPVTSEDRVLSRFTVVRGVAGAPGRKGLEGRLEEILFPATVYVGRACPPQDHAELYEVVSGRGGRARHPIPAADASRRGRWRGFSPEGFDTLTARYFCFPAGHPMGEEDLPPAAGEEPPGEELPSEQLPSSTPPAGKTPAPEPPPAGGS